MQQLPRRAAEFGFEGFVAEGAHYGGAFEGVFLHVDWVDRSGAVVGVGTGGVRGEEQDEGEGDEAEGGEEED